MLRALCAADEAIYMDLAYEFYHSEAVLHPVPQNYWKRTFDAIISGNPFVSCDLILEREMVVGYVLFAHTWSQESGGDVVWVEELYIRPQYRGKGMATRFFEELRQRYPQASRFRLEVEPDNERAKKLYRKMGFDFLEYQQMVLDTHCN